MDSILITGATGFLGKHLVEQLKDSGRRLILLSRGPSPWEGVSSIKSVRGDVTVPGDVMRAAEGASEICHLAGFVSRRPEDGQRLYRTHIEGARNVCEAAVRLGGIRLTIVSSSGTVAVSRGPEVHREDSGYKLDVVGEWPYYASKILAEKLAFEYYARHKLPVVAVNPSLLLGPGDNRRSSTGDLSLFLKGQILALPRGGLNFVDVRDAAQGLVAAIERGRPGERYLLGGSNWSFEMLIQNMARLTGKRAPKLKPPLPLALLSARALRTVYPWFGRPFELDDASIRMSELFWYCDSAKARSEFGFASRDPIETLKDTIADLQRKMA
ncbi:MAG: NAD-dependent epimerase/dehydratase family protein [Acidobacteriota bacterium]|nr:NAD-dependent epimerase/dehydratase family protein [Acidobacteriota bacterium]